MFSKISPGLLAVRYCDICDVIDHETEDCPIQTFESLSPDGMAQIGELSNCVMLLELH